MATSTGTERVPLEQASGRILAEEILTDRPSPACDVSAMDGYAVRLAEIRAGTLPVAAEARIGRAPVVLPPGAAARIVTGAPVPAGAEAVIRREDVSEHPDRISVSPSVAGALKAGDSIRRRGENAPAQRVVLHPGIVVGPVHTAALASVGAACPLVHRRVRVAILVTGDELLGVEATPAEWEIRDSNGPALVSLLSSLPYVQTLARRHAGDELDRTTEALREVAGDADLVFVTGGVSMGDRDFVPAALRSLGARTLFHKLPQRPGKPVLGGVLPSGTPVLALPGNPVSVLVTARGLGVPVIRKLAGVAGPLDIPSPVMLANPDGKQIDLWWHRPVRVTGVGGAELVANMGSGDVMGVAASDGFVEVPPHQTGAGPWPMYRWTI